jgi:ribosomal protein S2
MWNRIISYRSILKGNVQLSSVLKKGSYDSLLNSMMVNKFRGKYIMDLDKIILSLINNKSVLRKVVINNGNFLFLTSRDNYYSTITKHSNFCGEHSMNWFPSGISNPRINSTYFFKDKYVDLTMTTKQLSIKNDAIFVDFVVLFDNDKFSTKYLLRELNGIYSAPVLSLFDVNSASTGNMYFMFGNTQLLSSVYFYSFFVALCIDRYKNVNTKI